MMDDDSLWTHATDRAREFFIEFTRDLGDASMAATAMLCVSGEVIADLNGHEPCGWFNVCGEDGDDQQVAP